MRTYIAQFLNLSTPIIILASPLLLHLLNKPMMLRHELLNLPLLHLQVIFLLLQLDLGRGQLVPDRVQILLHRLSLLPLLQNHRATLTPLMALRLPPPLHILQLQLGSFQSIHQILLLVVPPRHHLLKLVNPTPQILVLTFELIHMPPPPSPTLIPVLSVPVPTLDHLPKPLHLLRALLQQRPQIIQLPLQLPIPSLQLPHIPLSIPIPTTRSLLPPPPPKLPDLPLPLLQLLLQLPLARMSVCQPLLLHLQPLQLALELEDDLLVLLDFHAALLHFDLEVDILLESRVNLVWCELR